MKQVKNFLSLCSLFFVALFVNAQTIKSISVYQQKFDDKDAICFTSGNFNITADGKSDVSDALQGVINDLKTKNNFGIVFIPGGSYLVSKTIYIPQAIRIIGYGENRPVFILKKNAPGFALPDSNDKGKAKYMFWFTSSLVQQGQPVRDAGAGSFYSALSNVDIKIESGNTNAVALRAHYAQHSFVSHVDIHIGSAKAGMFDVGNEMEDVRFFGGDYGIYTTKPSPGWQFMMTDVYFEGQKKAAIQSQEAGLTIVRMNVKNVPSAIDISDNYHEKLFMEDCQLMNVSGPAIKIGNEGNAFNQINLRNVDCKNVPVLVSYNRTKTTTVGIAPMYKIKSFTNGLQIDDLGIEPVYKTTQDVAPLSAFPSPVKKDIPSLPSMNTWVNIQSLGAKGDGETDDTKIIRDAVEKYETIYFPQGWYRITETITLKPNTAFIGLHPIATQIIISDNTEAFGSFGGPKPMIEAPQGGKNILTGIGLCTGAWNNRAVACKWMAGEGSYMNDVKFVGGHGTMNKPSPQNQNNQNGFGRNNQSRILPGMDAAWDTQFWSLWITNGGGGTFKDIWTANTFSSSGMYVSNTSTPARIYAMSVEHHVRNEVRFKNVSNWKVYALQLEEESRESMECQPMEIEDCSNMRFANLYMFRVIRVDRPYAYSIRTASLKDVEFLNVHNYSQIKFTTALTAYDVNTNTDVRPWELARLYYSGGAFQNASTNKMHRLAKGFEFASGICKDNKGNIYFCEPRFRRIYKWSVETNSLSTIADFPWEPWSLACDTKDNLIVSFKYVPRPGYLKNDKPEVFSQLPDAYGTSFSGWGNSGFGILFYSMNPNHPEETIRLLDKIPMGSIKNIHKALYPAGRWRDYHDFNMVSVNNPTEMYVAPDGVTVIPVQYDFARSAAMVEAFPGKTLYSSDEYDKRTVKLNVSSEGYLSDLTYFTEMGEFNSAVDGNGNVYVADGQVYIFNKEGKRVGEIEVPERPVTICLGGKDNKTLFITTNTSLYCVDITNQ
jgi:hypothetical protein